ncbi:UDP-N-acetylmuramoyl-tripeptide--D-alanyl-D-alanine ligase [Caldalkalibacillus mannanilyticus]|uniref:UDP-N-acetylmuramoyl-tripeptide--D-alanyl-D- alanine ligase n=1 Tax=Caldalkalibacillus mannanilyticus TaxID=1418 RepID=UPI0006891B30|nr:Mur ligase family protein [Caldalkalibacillus mannanilyticus]
MLDLQEIMNCTHGTLIQGEFEQSIDFVHFDSRKIEPNALFIALPGNQVDGHHFIHAAKQNGAICALISRTDFSFEGLEDISLIRVENTEQALQKLAAYYRQKLTIPIIGITGSNGKTTTKDMVTQLLSAKYQVYKTEGNLNNHLGLPLSLLQIKKHHTAAVLEMGMSQLGEIDFLANIAKPSISIITNIGDSHIEFLGSRDNIAKAKGEILPHTDPEQFILLNKDDPTHPLTYQGFMQEKSTILALNQLLMSMPLRFK